MKRVLITLLVIGVLAIVYMLGPRPSEPVYITAVPELNVELDELENYLQIRESRLDLRPENDATLVWAHDSVQPTEYVFFYLHGFSASRTEGNPVHLNLSKKFKSNLYLSRLTGHGLMANGLANFTAENIWVSALEELAIAEKLGKKVVVVSTSTGGTLALKMAAEFPDRIHALINLSPNIRINNPAAFMLNNPWGLEIAQLVYGGASRRIEHKQIEAPQFWDTIYPAEATVQLQELLETTMNGSTFQKVQCPVLNLYYYKDEENQDPVVKVSAVIDMHEKLGTAEGQKRLTALSTPGDHVIASWVKSQDYQIVEDEITAFCVEILGMSKAEGAY